MLRNRTKELPNIPRTHRLFIAVMSSFVADEQRVPGCTHVLLITTGSVASVKAPLIVQELQRYANVKVQVVATKPSLAFYSADEIRSLGVRVWRDEDEWPTSLLRALSPSTPTYVFPAMNTLMYEHPLTAEHLRIVRDVVKYNVVGPIAKLLACGDMGVGAMAEWRDIVQIVVDKFGLEYHIIATAVPFVQPFFRPLCAVLVDAVAATDLKCRKSASVDRSRAAPSLSSPFDRHNAMSADLVKALAALGLTGVAIKALATWRSSTRGLPYPPGPKPKFLIGNMLDIPQTLPWLTYADWAKQYGDIMHITILGAHIIVINSVEVATEILDKRSGNYSSRPDIPVMHMNGWMMNMGLKKYNDEWRADRRILHQQFRNENATNIHPIELAKMHELLKNLLATPDDFTTHFKTRVLLSFWMSAAFTVLQVPNLDYDITYEALGMFSGSVVPGTLIVNVFPFLRHFPSWTPGLGALHKLCARSRLLLGKMQDVPFYSVKQHMAAGDAVPSWVSELLERTGADKVPDANIKALGAITLAAAMETTLSALRAFVHMMVLHPEIQKKAQAELDAVVGDGRLPNFDDRDSLPYSDALYREIMRLHGPAPLGVPHASSEDDVYNGFFIPKGSTIMYNQWAMCRDARIYPDPDAFKPERFIAADGSLIKENFPPTYGYGRRICAGKSMADASVWIAIASILSVFNMTKAKDAAGNDIPVPDEYIDGLVTSVLHLSHQYSAVNPAPDRKQRARALPMLHHATLRGAPEADYRYVPIQAADEPDGVRCYVMSKHKGPHGYRPTKIPN
ncbi:O-methylsterigmatocystin oxidoreductase [Mycena kentingensis (nom. inval.)]|nr:O-methylsterigmatocystin oxidoreductase [Mycena kentingensis (nom. inval.)]